MSLVRHLKDAVTLILGNARQAYAMAGYSQNNSLPTQQKEAHELLYPPKVAPRISELQAIAQRRAEAEYGITVDRLTDMLMDTYESGSDGHAGSGNQATTELTFKLGHSMGADHLVQCPLLAQSERRHDGSPMSAH